MLLLAERLRRAKASQATILEQIQTQPELIFKRAGLKPDPWQIRFLRSTAMRESLLCSRQVGKSTASAAKGLHLALTKPDQTVLVFSPTQRQSTEFLSKARWFWKSLQCGIKLSKDAATELKFENGSRIISLPDAEEGIRGYTGDMVIIDEGSRVSDALYYSVRPMLGARNGRLLTLSTPFGKRGWFFEEWEGITDPARVPEEKKKIPWTRYKVTCHESSVLSKDFIEEERATFGDRWFGQEYLCEYNDTVDSVFAADDILRAMSSDVQPLF